MLEAVLLTSAVVLLVMATVATLTLVALTLWRVVTSLRGLLHALTRASEQLNQALTDLPQVSAPARAESTLVEDGEERAARHEAAARHQVAGVPPEGPARRSGHAPLAQTRQRPRRRR